MGWNDPPLPWSEFERRLSDGRPSNQPDTANGGDSPAWSRKRQPFEPPASVTSALRPTTNGGVSYAELHCHSNFSFLDGASHPEELAEEAARLGLSALALTDHDGMYGVVRFAEAAAAVGLPTVFGAEVAVAGMFRGHNPRKLGAMSSKRGSGGDRQGTPDPGGSHLVVLARGPEGYARLCRVISEAQLAGGEKGRPRFSLSALCEGHDHGHWLVLTGCRKGAVCRALVEQGPTAAARALADLVACFGRDNVAVELWDHGDPLDSVRNDALVELAVRAGVDVVATNNVHYATPARRRLATALAAVRARRSLDEIDGWLPPAGSAHLRSGAEMARRFARYPGVVERAAALGAECAFDLRLVAPKLPDWPVPPGHTEMTWLRHLTLEGAARRYGPPEAERVPGAYRQIAYELDLIEQLGFAGYFLVVHDIVEFCRRSGIYCQGRGSAANSAACYALGITNADAVALGLLFERFLSPERDGPPDIDIDIEAARREEAIQYVYERYGRERAAQVANVITYRPKSAVRDMAKALGHSPGQQDAWSKQVDAWGPLPSVDTARCGDGDPTLGRSTALGPRAGGRRPDDTDIPAPVMALAAEVQGFPRHLGIHSGGMVICDRPVVEVCPVEWGRMAGRTVLQWDKDDCAAVGLVKFDLLGLGMLTVLHEAVDLVGGEYGVEVDLATLPQEDEVYAMLSRADSVGVFQVESRAQMATLPRLAPRCFYDLVVEVALIRPGPIQGGSVHPYLRRRNGAEPVTYLHPLLEPSLKKTLGVPLFQEQLMQMAIDVAGFSAADADQLRQAMSAKRSHSRMEALRARLYAGMATRGIDGEVADAIWDKLVAFANFGFPESHSVSFAYLVYASAWLKWHYPAAFLAACLNGQPMGFWSPQTLVADARRHGVVVLGPDVNASAAKATLCELGEESGAGAPLSGTSSPHPFEPVPESGARAPLSSPRCAGAVRLGIEYVRTIGKDLAGRMAEGRPYADMEDVVRRCMLSQPQVEALATAGAFACFDLDRRGALWSAGAVSQAGAGRLAGVVTGAKAPPLPPMTPVEEAASDLWATGISPTSSPTEFARPALEKLGVVTAAGLWDAEPGSRVLVAGMVTHRQRPATASGTTFVNLEDETGLVNVVCSQGVWARHRRVARSCPALLIRGRLERAEGVINVVADRIEPLHLSIATRSRDFR
ncbi:MAG: error-prone DNA polymerase [Actinomycetota bacterium]|nr:error-prone DNA polymerase [Actinomycetota bacterium]